MKLLLTVLFLVGPAQSWNDGSVLLRDIQALTLYKNRMTTARRSSPVPQLKCVGGSAGCHVFTPEAVQCLNRGWDGVDVQWECKTDMDNRYRFGRIEVSCEGYSHPADDYVLKGSCGLEYTLELTAEGQKSSSGMGGLGGFASSFFSGFSEDRRQQNPRKATPPAGEGSGDLLVVVVLLLLGFGVYKLFLSGDAAQQPGQPQSGGYGHTAGPPPPGSQPYRSPPTTGGFTSSSSSPPPPSSSSSGTRTASGFGGTRKR
ncbi:unnamed protein product [Menidia menidia]|uniref:Store-operated calcium entry-associated regulatory factor n=1 Tax=Menidia menidia TaxID=238744 RepID=A0A8S4B7A2_9TELE|nr:unnamed protein product [Menidia menidia]